MMIQFSGENCGKFFLEIGEPKHLVYLINRLYEDGTVPVRLDYMDSEKFKSKSRVGQGCIFLRSLFNIFIRIFDANCSQKWGKARAREWK